MMSTPIDTLRRSPPDTPLVPSSPIYVFLADYNQTTSELIDNPSCSIKLSTRCIFSFVGIEPSRKSAANIRVSKTVSLGKSLSSCMIYAEVLLIKLVLISMPSK